MVLSIYLGNRASLEAELGYIDKILDHTTDDDGFIYFKVEKFIVFCYKMFQILLGDGSVVWKKNENMNCDASKIIAYWSRFAKVNKKDLAVTSCLERSACR